MVSTCIKPSHLLPGVLLQHGGGAALTGRRSGGRRGHDGAAGAAAAGGVDTEEEEEEEEDGDDRAWSIGRGGRGALLLHHLALQILVSDVLRLIR